MIHMIHIVVLLIINDLVKIHFSKLIFLGHFYLKILSFYSRSASLELVVS